MTDNSYWGKNGKYQQDCERLRKLIPTYGEVSENDALELFRVVGNIYYDLHNNGLANVEFKLSELRPMMKQFKSQLILEMGRLNYRLVYECWVPYERQRGCDRDFDEPEGYFPEWDESKHWFSERLESAFESLVDASVLIAKESVN